MTRTTYKVGFRVWLPGEDSEQNEITLETWYTGLEPIGQMDRTVADWAHAELCEMCDHERFALDELCCYQIVGEATISATDGGMWGEPDGECVIGHYEVQQIPLAVFDKYFQDKAERGVEERTLLLDLAWEWVCPDCSHRNFVSMTSEELSREENEEVYRIQNELEDWQEVPEAIPSGMWNTCPKRVTCAKCHSRFRTINDDPPPENSDSGDNDDFL